MEQHSHLNQNHTQAFESKVCTSENVESLAHEAVKNIPNATEFLNNYFNKNEADFQRLPRPVVKDQLRHHGFGTTY